jgi:hypothetical protein
MHEITTTDTVEQVQLEVARTDLSPLIHVDPVRQRSLTGTSSSSSSSRIGTSKGTAPAALCAADRMSSSSVTSVAVWCTAARCRDNCFA